VGVLSLLANPYNLSGKVKYPANHNAGVAKTLLINNYCLRALEIPLNDSDFFPNANVDVIRETIIPKALIIKG
jgi:hypothetical protein